MTVNQNVKYVVIARDGRTDIKDHIPSEKHKSNTYSARISQSLDSYLCQNLLNKKKSVRTSGGIDHVLPHN